MPIVVENGIIIGNGITIAGGASPSPGVDNVVGYNQMPPPVIPGTNTEDPTATVNGSTGFTINDDSLTGVTFSAITASNHAWFVANYPTIAGTYTCTFGPGSTIPSSTIFVYSLTATQIQFLVQGQVGPATYNFPFTFGL
jgi:hypothetical protein